jgi:hypothetical protein
MIMISDEMFERITRRAMEVAEERQANGSRTRV